MKKLLAVLLSFVCLLSVAYADNNILIGSYNIMAKDYFNIPQLDLKSYYLINDTLTGGVAQVFQDGHCAIGFITNEDGENIGALCIDQTNDPGAFLLRCACLMCVIDMWDEANFHTLFFAYIQMNREPDSMYEAELRLKSKFTMINSKTGMAAYILGE